MHVGHAPVRVTMAGRRATATSTSGRSQSTPLRWSTPPTLGGPAGEPPPGGETELGIAIERIRFALAVEEDMGEFYEAFKRDPLLGPTIHHKPWVRPRRRPWPWEALCWAITEQLIEAPRAAEIQRRIVRRWAPSINLATSSASRPGARARGGDSSDGRSGTFPLPR